MTKVQVEGLKELKGALMELSSSVRRGVLERTLRKAAEPLAQTMKAYAPYEDGQLVQSIIVSAEVQSLARLAGNRAYSAAMVQGFTRPTAAAAMRAASKTLRGQYSIGVSVGPRAKAAPHAHWVEFGTGPRFHKSGRYVGVMPADPFMRPAWDLHRNGMVGSIASQLRTEIDAAVARAARRAVKKG